MKKLFYLLIFLSLTELAILRFISKPQTSTKAETLGCVPVADANQPTDEYDPSEIRGEFLGNNVNVPPITTSFAYVLGEQVGAKRIEVNLASQRVYAYDGNSKLFEFVVSTGKWAPTPRGTFTIERKIRAQKMSGGNKANNTYYYLPNVPWVMFFGNNQIPWSRGFSFHGTYWHNNFGQPMSHGCINMKTPEAEQLYTWAPIGTPVIIY